MQKFIDLLGYRAKDRITGFSGVVSSVCFDLYGCIQVCLTQGVDDKGQIPERGNQWFDTNRLDIDKAQGRVMNFKVSERYDVANNAGPCESRPY